MHSVGLIWLWLTSRAFGRGAVLAVVRRRLHHIPQSLWVAWSRCASAAKRRADVASIAQDSTIAHTPKSGGAGCVSRLKRWWRCAILRDGEVSEWLMVPLSKSGGLE